MPEKVIVITGPTASGKTRLGAAIAKELLGEVISADSMQIYKYMDIGTAKPKEEEIMGIPHHMLDVVSPFENYSVARYVEDASRCAEDIISRGKVPVIVGGTGLYIESLISGRDFAPRSENDVLRRELEAEYDALGGEKMLEKLFSFDPDRANKLHPNDKKRVVRALEAAMEGKALSGHDAGTQKKPPRFDAKTIVLNFSEREELYKRIDSRVDKMMAEGLYDEVLRLLEMGVSKDATAMQAIGYKEMVSAAEGEITKEEAAELIKLGSRRYAKRQISWCNRYKDALRVNWGPVPDFDDALRISTGFLAGQV